MSSPPSPSQTRHKEPHIPTELRQQASVRTMDSVPVSTTSSMRRGRKGARGNAPADHTSPTSTIAPIVGSYRAPGSPEIKGMGMEVLTPLGLEAISDTSIAENAEEAPKSGRFFSATRLL